MHDPSPSAQALALTWACSEPVQLPKKWNIVPFVFSSPPTSSSYLLPTVTRWISQPRSSWGPVPQQGKCGQWEPDQHGEQQHRQQSCSLLSQNLCSSSELLPTASWGSLGWPASPTVNLFSLPFTSPKARWGKSCLNWQAGGANVSSAVGNSYLKKPIATAHIYTWVQSHEAAVDTVQVALNQLAQMLITTRPWNVFWLAKPSRALSKYLCSSLSEHHSVINTSAHGSLSCTQHQVQGWHKSAEQLVRSSVVFTLCISF